jgi:hypothetical protein
MNRSLNSLECAGPIGAFGFDTSFSLPVGTNNAGSIQWSWSCIHAANAGLVDNPHVQITIDANLTRQADVISQFGFDGQTISLELTHLAGVSLEHFDPACCAPRVSAAAVKNVYASVFNGEYKLLAHRGINGHASVDGFSSNLRH